VIQPNVSLEAFISDSLPSLLADDALSQQSPCLITIPCICHTLMVVVTMFMQEDIDIVTYGEDNQWLCNTRFCIGKKLTSHRQKMIVASKEGLEHLFRLKEDTPVDVCKEMVDTTRYVCCLKRRKDGNIVGDCESCYKQLGYLCPGATYLRNKFGLLDHSLKARRKEPANARNGVCRAANRGSGRYSYISGLQEKGKKSRSTPRMCNSNEDFLETLNQSQLVMTIKYLGLLSRKELM
jgi:hypothetical protein